MQSDVWFQVFLRSEKLLLLIELLHILGCAEVDLEGEDVRITVDYDKLDSEQVGKVVNLQNEHHFTLSIGNR